MIRFHKIYTLVFLITVSIFSLKAQVDNNAKWNNKKCAVVLTYDDAIDGHLDNVIPILDSLGMKGTFYVIGNSNSFKTRMNEWKQAAYNGHELGNHTLYHPCAGKSKGRNWVNPDYDLDTYTVTRIVDEIKLLNAFLKNIDGKEKRTFAYTCGDKKAGDSLFVELLGNDFVGARSGTSGINQLNNINLFDIKAYRAPQISGESLIDIVKKAQKEKGLVVFYFHGVGGGHGINISLSKHNELLKYLSENKEDIWIAPMIEVAEYIKSYSEKNGVIFQK